MPKTLSINGPAVLRFPNGRSVGVDARITMNLSVFPVLGDGEFTTDGDTASHALRSGESLSLTFAGTAPTNIIVHEAKLADTLALCWFRVHL